MDETPKKSGYGIYRMLDTVKSKLPEEYKDYIYNGIYVGLKSDYIRYILNPSRDNRMIFYMLFVKDDINRSLNHDGSKYRKSDNALWFYLCSGFNKYELQDLTSPIRRELFNYMNEHEIVAMNYYNEEMFREETLFYFDDSNELHHTSKYSKYVEQLKNKYTNKP